MSMGRAPKLRVGELLINYGFNWQQSRDQFASKSPDLVTARWLHPRRQLCDAIDRAVTYAKQRQEVEASPECMLLGILDVQEVHTELVRQLTKARFTNLREELECRLGVRYPAPLGA